MTDTFFKQFANAIGKNMKYKLYVDKLPSAVIKRNPQTGVLHKEYHDAIPIGKMVEDEVDGKWKHLLYNHWILTVKTSPVPNSKSHRIVGFEVEPRSYYPDEPLSLEFKKHRPLYLEDLNKMYQEGQIKSFPFSYSIQTVVDNETTWTLRMEHYLKFGNEKIHYGAIILSLTVIVALSTILCTVLKRGVNADIIQIAK